MKILATQVTIIFPEEPIVVNSRVFRYGYSGLTEQPWPQHAFI